MAKVELRRIVQWRTHIVAAARRTRRRFRKSLFSTPKGVANVLHPHLLRRHRCKVVTPLPARELFSERVRKRVKHSAGNAAAELSLEYLIRRPVPRSVSPLAVTCDLRHVRGCARLFLPITALTITRTRLAEPERT